MSGASDLLAHLRPCPVEVVFDNRTYVIPAMDAVEWIVLIDGPHPDLYEIFPTKAGQEAIEHVEDAMWEGRFSTDDVARVALEAIGAAADRKWWIAMNVLAAAKGSWDIVHVNRAVGMSLAGWIDEIWSKIMTHIDPKKRVAWVSDVERAPKGWDAEIDFDEEERAFLNAMKAVMK